MLYRPPKQAKQAPKGRRRKVSVRLEVQDAFKFLAKLKPGSVDLIVSSPPYCMGKEYDTSGSIDDFVADHKRLAPLLMRALKDGGSLCWQVGHHVRNGVTIPLDALVYSIFAEHEELFLRNRIIWTFGHGVHASRRFSGRHETILWFTKGTNYEFNLDAVRVPQKYPGKRHYKGPKKGEWSGNPLGKNPSDVWEIPNVKSRHIEKTCHPCQFPVALIQRLIRALTKRGGLVVDPFMGSGTSAASAAIEGRRFAGCDVNRTYVMIAKRRVAEAKKKQLGFRPLDRPIYRPAGNEAVAKRPPAFRERHMSKITHTGPKKGKISRPTEIPCFEFTQGKYKLYAFVLDAKTAWSIFSISRMTEDDDDDEDFGYQRILSPARLSNITRYITSGKPIPNSILVSLDKASYNAHKRTLEIPRGTDVAWVIDGQHRLAGAFQASQNKHNISLLVVAFIGLTEKEQVEQFITINDEARGVPRSILLDLNRRLSFAKTEKETSEDRAGDVANALRRDPESIFFNKITVVESPKTGQIISREFCSQGCTAGSPHKGYTSNAISC